MAFELPPGHEPLAWKEQTALRPEYWEHHTGFVEYVRSLGATVLKSLPADEQPWVDGELPVQFELGEGEDSVLIKYDNPIAAQYRLGSFAMIDEPLVFLPHGPDTFALDVRFARRRDQVGKRISELKATGNSDDRATAEQLYTDFLAEKDAYLEERAGLEARYSESAS